MYSVAVIVSDAGTYTLIPAVPGRKIRVVNYCITTSTSSNTVQFFSNLTPLTGVMHTSAGVPIAPCAGQLFPSGALMLFQGAVGEPIKITTTTNNGVVGGHLVYILAD
jgi:hypothetical protein